VLKEKADSWHHDLSPSSRQERLESLLNALKNLADTGLGAASVLANLHHRRIVPLMERELRIYEMSEAANPTSLVLTRNVHLAPSTQQAEQAGFTRAEITRRASQFFLKINKR
jgi:hypothetical protein